MSPPAVSRVTPGWLALREAADAAARSTELVAQLRSQPRPAGRHVIHDLGCGTGAMGRWLAPRLSGPQRWVLHDQDADLLELAVAAAPVASDGAPVSAQARRSDITRLRAGDLADATLITASALLDVLTEEELTRLIGVCAAVGCPLLLTLSVIGDVGLTPAEPMDGQVAAAFNAHQRRSSERGRLLGPDAVACAAATCRRHGARVLGRPSPWRLGPSQADLTAEWLTGWVGAACEQHAGLAADAGPYLRRRRAQAGAGELAVSLGHTDLLVLPEPASAG